MVSVFAMIVKVILKNSCQDMILKSVFCFKKPRTQVNKKSGISQASIYFMSKWVIKYVLKQIRVDFLIFLWLPFNLLHQKKYFAMENNPLIRLF